MIMLTSAGFKASSVPVPSIPPSFKYLSVSALNIADGLASAPYLVAMSPSSWRSHQCKHFSYDLRWPDSQFWPATILLIQAHVVASTLTSVFFTPPLFDICSCLPFSYEVAPFCSLAGICSIRCLTPQCALRSLCAFAPQSQEYPGSWTNHLHSLMGEHYLKVSFKIMFIILENSS